MDILTQAMQAAGAVSEKVNDVNSRLSSEIEFTKNDIIELQNAVCELSEQIEQILSKLDKEGE